MIRSLTTLVLLPLTASALTYTGKMQYTDSAAMDLETKVAVDVLTEERVVEGHPDGSFRSGNLLNRAEFMKIVMGLYPEHTVQGFESHCFPDVPEGIWYEAPVCMAKAMRIVEGNAIPGVPQSQWLFAPNRPVQYEEAVKVLINIFALTPDFAIPSEQWYERYLRTAEGVGLALTALQPGHRLTRGQMARLAAGFLAFENGELEILRALQRGEDPFAPDEPEIPEDIDCTPIVCEDNSVHATCTPDGHPINYFAYPCDVISQEPTEDDGPPVQYDTDPDLSQSPTFLLLGTDGPLLGAINVFSDTEPFSFEDVTISLVSEASSVESIVVYDHDRALLGVASRSGTNPKNYVLSLGRNDLVVEKDMEYSFYVRPRLKREDHGGVSGQSVDLSSVRVEGYGQWSNNPISKTSVDNFPEHQTARSIITSISNAGDDQAVLVAGPDQELGSYRFEGVRGDGRADLRVTDLTFRIEQAGGITIANPQIANSIDSGTRYDCAVVGNEVVCSSIPEGVGSFESGPLTIRFFGDVTIPAGLSRGSLQLSIREAGTILSPGSVVWTDGTTSFSWVPFHNPVARGTYHSF